MAMPEQMYQRAAQERATRRKELAPGIHEAFEDFRAVCVAAEIRPGGPYTHATPALNAMEHASRYGVAR
jgi:hypothetical protein